MVELGARTREYVIELKVTAEYQHLGRSVEQAGLRHLKGLFLFQIQRGREVIAIHRHGERIRRKVGDIVLHPGDVLLLLAGRDFRKRWYHSRDFYLVSEAEEIPSRPKWQAYLTGAVFVLMVALTVMDVLSLVVAAGLAAMVAVASRSIVPEEARQSVDWGVLVIIAVAIAAAASFSSPISSPTNLLVYGPGGYRFSDFLKMGLPLQGLVGIVAIGLICFIYL